MGENKNIFNFKSLNIIIIYITLFVTLTLLLLNSNKSIKNQSDILSNSFKPTEKSDLPEGFEFIDKNNTNGPITLDREMDNGQKRNLFEIVTLEDDSFYYNYEEFKNLAIELPQQSEYICESNYNYTIRPEVQKGHDISCPRYYTIVVDKAFYGRYKDDNANCMNKKNKNIMKECGYEPLNQVKQLCEGKNYCSIIASNLFYTKDKKDVCNHKDKYLHIEYHCKKDDKLKKEKIAIVMFYNGIKVNSLEESSVSEFYQYSKIHGYDLFFTTNNYSPSRQIYFMKIYAVIDKITEGLRTKKYDWIFWIDSDTIINNPNIKLESFLPNEKMNKVHLIAAFDYRGRKDMCCGLNSGAFFIRVHEWSLDLLMRIITYPYFNKEKELRYPEQIAMNNILLEYDESEHYVIAPYEWFNRRDNSQFICHLMADNKQKAYEEKLKLVKDHQDKYNKTNKAVREEVLKYYNLPREKQLKIILQP